MLVVSWGASCLSLAGAATKYHFCRDKHAFVATKHVFCRGKSMLAATKIILVAAPANDRLDRLGNCRCLSVRTGECVGCQSVWSFLSVSWGEDWTMCCQSFGELPVGVYM